MTHTDLFEYLARLPYPGRGLLLGRSLDGQRAVAAYFIMGRSENSRNRVFALREGRLYTEPADPAKVTDPSLILYTPLRMLGENTLILSNGDQTDTVYDALAAGGTFEAALRTRSFEPDAPNYTPRVTGLLTFGGGEMAYRLSIVKSDGSDLPAPQRFFFEYPQPRAGEGRLIHTYAGGDGPLAAFAGEPLAVCLRGEDIDTLTAALWNALDLQNRVSLFVRSIDLSDGHTETRIMNQRG